MDPDSPFRVDLKKAEVIVNATPNCAGKPVPVDPFCTYQSYQSFILKNYNWKYFELFHHFSISLFSEQMVLRL